jgi:hypothetical protein
MIKYRGYRLEAGNYASDNVVEVSIDDGETWRYLDWGLRWVNHSPTGLNWGYGGSGCAQLAFAILFHYFKYALGFSSENAHKMVEGGMYQNFKWAFVSKWKDSWEITDYEISEWIRNYYEVKEK